MADVLRRKTGAERLAMAGQMFVRARELIRGQVRKAHPSWTEQEIAAEVVRRISRDFEGIDSETRRRIQVDVIFSPRN